MSEPKYPEGSISPSGAYVVRGGRWVATSSGQPSNTPASILGAAYLGGAQPTGVRREEFERGAEAGAMAVPAVASLALGGPALQVAKRGLALAATPGGGAVIGGLEGASDGPMGALEGAAKGAAGGYIAGVPGKVLQFLTRFKKAEQAARIAAAQAKGLENADKTVRSVGLNPKAIKAAMERRLSTTGTIPASVPPPRAMGPVAPTTTPAAGPSAQEIADKVMHWRDVNKFSNGQIVDALGNVYGIKPSIAKQMVKVLSGGS